jgi:hypothetical protein
VSLKELLADGHILDGHEPDTRLVLRDGIEEEGRIAMKDAIEQSREV